MQTYGPAMQRNSKTLAYVMFQMSTSGHGITRALILNHHRSIAWSMIVCLSTRCCLQLTNMSH